MNVLVCIPCLLTGGTEIQTLSLVEALVEAGHAVEVACYFENSPLMVKRYENAGAAVRVMSEEGKRPSGMFPTIRHLWFGLRRIVKEFKPDVAHVQYMAPGALPIVILRALGVKRIIATSHTGGDIHSTNGLRVIRLLTNHVLTAFQCITERAEKSYFGDSRLFDGLLSRHFTIYNNIPSHISILSEPRPVKTDEETIMVGVVSRLESIKGMDLVVPAFAKAYRRNQRLRLLVVGDGSQRELMERLAREEGVTDRVEFAGRRVQSELQGYYDRIDILLMPSRSEGFGLTAIEGMARGCVPIVANVGGLPEVVTAECGFLHKPEDIDDISLQILNSSVTLYRKSMASMNRADQFSSFRYRSNIKNLYSLI